MELFVAALSSGQVFIIFDGIDEVVNPEKYKHLAEMILELFEQFTNNKIWFTSRVLGFSLANFFNPQISPKS